MTILAVDFGLGDHGAITVDGRIVAYLPHGARVGKREAALIAEAAGDIAPDRLTQAGVAALLSR